MCLFVPSDGYCDLSGGRREERTGSLKPPKAQRSPRSLLCSFPCAGSQKSLWDGEIGSSRQTDRENQHRVPGKHLSQEPQGQNGSRRMNEDDGRSWGERGMGLGGSRDLGRGLCLHLCVYFQKRSSKEVTNKSDLFKSLSNKDRSRVSW